MRKCHQFLKQFYLGKVRVKYINRMHTCILMKNVLRRFILKLFFNESLRRRIRNKFFVILNSILPTSNANVLIVILFPAKETIVK